VIIVIIAVIVAGKTVHGAVQDEVPMDQDKACEVLEDQDVINL
jgi:hypothetical protein